jgi:hypothetical protein
MILATTCVGDISVTVFRVSTLTRGSPDPEERYQLHFRDLSTDTRFELDADGEGDAMLLLAAWIAADEESLGSLEPQRVVLINQLPKGLMP